jgi:hypothetical protein
MLDSKQRAIGNAAAAADLDRALGLRVADFPA